MTKLVMNEGQKHREELDKVRSQGSKVGGLVTRGETGDDAPIWKQRLDDLSTNILKGKDRRGSVGPA